MRLEYENCSRILCYLSEEDIEFIWIGFRLYVTDEGFEFEKIKGNPSGSHGELETRLKGKDLILSFPRWWGCRNLKKELGKVIESDGSFKYSLILKN
ncbi:hypothetical protein CL618_01285 [archaeon]|nr:hypothetical protein [archaeon]|tara:strand:- start:1422 stop:1712 length:291 start_codon:yes stop_codon:yes gene_type:complete